MSGKKRRTVHIDGNEWVYAIGRQFIEIWDPNGKKRAMKKHELLGITYEEWCDELWNYYDGEYWGG